MIDTSFDIDAAMQDAGAAVTYGAQSCYGILDRSPVNEILDSEVREIGQRITLTIRHDALSALANDATITVQERVGGVLVNTDFLIRDVGEHEADGTRELTLVEA